MSSTYPVQVTAQREPPTFREDQKASVQIQTQLPRAHGHTSPIANPASDTHDRESKTGLPVKSQHLQSSSPYTKPFIPSRPKAPPDIPYTASATITENARTLEFSFPVVDESEEEGTENVSRAVHAREQKSEREPWEQQRDVLREPTRRHTSQAPSSDLNPTNASRERRLRGEIDVRSASLLEQESVSWNGIELKPRRRQSDEGKDLYTAQVPYNIRAGTRVGTESKSAPAESAMRNIQTSYDYGPPPLPPTRQYPQPQPGTNPTDNELSHPRDCVGRILPTARAHTSAPSSPSANGPGSVPLGNTLQRRPFLPLDRDYVDPLSRLNTPSLSSSSSSSFSSSSSSSRFPHKHKYSPRPDLHSESKREDLLLRLRELNSSGAASDLTFAADPGLDSRLPLQLRRNHTPSTPTPLSSSSSPLSPSPSPLDGSGSKLIPDHPVPPPSDALPSDTTHRQLHTPHAPPEHTQRQHASQQQKTESESPSEESECEDKILTEYGIQRKDLTAERCRKILESFYPLPVYECRMQSSMCCDSGGFSMVYCATLPQSTTQVSVKVMRSQVSQQPWKPLLHLLREVKAWRGLDHPNIIPLHGYSFGPFGGNIPAMVAPWYKNGNLRVFLKMNGATSDRKLNLVAEIARGLEYLHGRNPSIIHGDMKPENILIDDDHHARLCDLGIAKVMDQNSGLTTGMHYTSTYKAPELGVWDGRSRKRPDQWSDIWALGIIFLEVSIHPKTLSPQHLRKGETLSGYLFRKVSLAKDHSTFIKRCWDGVPDQRPSASEVIVYTEEFLQAMSAGKVDV